MSRRDSERLEDILEAVHAIRSHLRRGDLSDGLVFDAVRVRLIEIGEAVKGLGAEALATEPEMPWQDIGRMRDRLAHRYFDTSHGIVQGTVDHDLPPLELAVHRLQAVMAEQDPARRRGQPERIRVDIWLSGQTRRRVLTAPGGKIRVAASG